MSTDLKLPSVTCINQRIRRHGSDIVLNRGRPKLSLSHKKNARKEYLNNKKLKKIEDGTYRPRGRPKQSN
jgi:hypothetical protein